MALLYDPTIRYLAAQSLFNSVGGRSSSSGVEVFSVEGNDVSISIYSGAQPTAAQVEASWSTYNSSKSIFLLHFETGVAWGRRAADASIAITKYPPTRVALNSGTATWAICWGSTVALATVASSTLPSVSNGFAVVPVSSLAGNGIIKLTDTNIVAGSSYTIRDGAFSFVAVGA